MITSNYQVDGDIYSYADKFFCDSRDDKPSNADAKDGLINGAILEETDTGKTYIFDKKANKWTEKSAGGGGGGGSTTLAGLTDVDISNPSDGQTLVYNVTSGKWENADNVFQIMSTFTGLNGTITDRQHGHYLAVFDTGFSVDGLDEDVTIAFCFSNITINSTVYSGPFYTSGHGEITSDENYEVGLETLMETSIIFKFNIDALSEVPVETMTISGYIYSVSKKLQMALGWS